MTFEGSASELDSQDIEIQLLLEAIYLKYGYDFRDYSRAHTKRRILKRLTESAIENISLMQHKVLTERSFFESILPDFSINVTEMFRDPSFFAALRQELIPILKTYPFVKIWHAGCSSGEEVYTMAIILREEGLYNRAQIYATDINENILTKAREAIYPIDSIKNFTNNYQKAGGLASFSDYYIAKYNFAILDKSIKERIIFAEHNLVTDGVFGEMNIIICRNVLIYFNRKLQNKVIKLFYDSLSFGGFLCLGSKETISFSECAGLFELINEKEKIFRKKYIYLKRGNEG